MIWDGVPNSSWNDCLSPPPASPPASPPTLLPTLRARARALNAPAAASAASPRLTSSPRLGAYASSPALMTRSPRAHADRQLTQQQWHEERVATRAHMIAKCKIYGLLR